MNRIQHLFGLFLIIVLLSACTSFSTLTPENQQPPNATNPKPANTLPASVQPAYDKTSQPSQASVYRMRLRLTTTSDWTRVIFENATLAVTEQNIIQGADAPQLTIVQMPEIAIGKPGLDQTKLVVEFEAYIPVVDAESIKIAIGKGNIGATQVELFNFNQDQPILVATLDHSGVVNTNDPLNKKYFNIPAIKLAEGGPRILPIRSYPQTVLAFYYPWYGLQTGPSGEARVWDYYRSVRTPTSGFYDSHDSGIVGKQIDQAQSSGIDGFVVSWWGINDFTDRALRNVILPAAQKAGFGITIYYEYYEQDRSQVLKDFAYIIKEYGQNPAFMKMDGRPVLFVYDSVIKEFSRMDWEFIFQSLDQQGLTCFCVADGISAAYHLGDAQFSFLFDLFQGIHTYLPLGYSMEFLQEFYNSNSLKAIAKGILFAATAAPGFDNSLWATALGKEEIVFSRQDGQLYRQTWNAAVDSNPQWILITSFNEWPEGSEIEPSRELGDQYLQLTRELVDSWKLSVSPPETIIPPVALFTGTWEGIDPADGSMTTLVLVQTENSLTGTFKDTYSPNVQPPGYEGSGSGTILSTTNAQITFSLTRWDGKSAQAQYSLTLSEQNNTLTLGCDVGCPITLQRQ
jgi:hypothetical protein